MSSQSPNFNENKPLSDSSFYIDKKGLEEAYYACLQNKRSTVSAVTFRIDERQNLNKLYDEITSGVYYPTTSIAFITENREVFAAHFRDRIVHTWIAIRIIPLLEAQFVPTTWNCRKGKGTMRAVQSLREQIKKVSENYTKDAWVLIYDLSGFFMSIDRTKAADKLCRFIESRYVGEDKNTLLWLLRVVITHAPEEDCVRYGGEEAWAGLPHRKSLFYCHGLPIGDLPSQLDGNFELDIVDHFLVRLFEHNRYVDDTALLSDNKEALLNMMPTIRELLRITCGATVNPRKYKFVHWRQGFKYLGVIINKDKAYPSGRVVGRAYNMIRYFNHIKRKGLRAQDFINSVNSYFGLMKHYDCKEARDYLLSLISPEWNKFILIGENGDKIMSKFPFRQQLSTKLRRGRRMFNQLRYSVKCELLEHASLQPTM